jgi:hypothetical protein
MQNLELHQRMTHTYADGWADLDDWQHLGTAKMLRWNATAEPLGFDDAGTFTTKVIGPRELRAVDLSRAIAATLGGSSCTHEHDCCGCPTTHASVKRTSAREYFVHLHITRNY